MRIRWKAVIIAFIVVFASTAARAEPSPTVQYLMRTEVSMFSYGLSQLTEHLGELNKTLGLNGVFPLYNWDHNQVVVNAVAVNQKGFKADAEGCRNIANAIRLDAGIDAATGAPLFGTHSVYSFFFSPSGYERKDAPKDWEANLDKIIVIDISIADSDSSINCRADLLGTTILIEEGKAAAKAKVAPSNAR